MEHQTESNAMPTTAALAVVAGGAAYYSSSQSKGASDAATTAANDAYAQQSANLEGLQLGDFKTYEAFDIFQVAQDAANFNQNNTDHAIQMAMDINAASTNDLEAAMAQLFGGTDALNSQRNAVNANVNQWLSGQVSQSTQDQLGRAALASGATDLGSGAVSDLYTGYLGLTKEQLVGQGMSAFQSLYGMYRQALPLVTGAQMLPYTTFTPADAVQAEEYNRLNEANSSMQAAALQYQADYNQVTGQNLILGNQAQTTGQAAYNTAAANSSVVNAIASALTTGYGSYMGGMSGFSTAGAGATGAYGSTYSGAFKTPTGYTAAYKPQVVT